MDSLPVGTLGAYLGLVLNKDTKINNKWTFSPLSSKENLLSEGKWVPNVPSIHWNKGNRKYSVGRILTLSGGVLTTSPCSTENSMVVLQSLVCVVKATTLYRASTRLMTAISREVTVMASTTHIILVGYPPPPPDDSNTCSLLPARELLTLEKVCILM